MSEHRESTSARAALCRVICVLLLAATAAACDKCGDLFSPMGYFGGSQPEACRDQAPKPR